MTSFEERLSPRGWAAIAMAAACAPFVEGASLSRIFYVRDLSMFFWPRHLWLRQVLRAGHWPLWDPFAAAGQPVFPDALNQMFLPPVLLLRLLLPAVLGFNLIVAAPFPLAALGTWLFLRRHVHDSSAAAGAIVFAVSGPVVSTANFPNLSWSIAWIPWILWAADRDGARRSGRSFAVLAMMIALQMLSGEPVTMMGTMALLMFYLIVCSEPPALYLDAARLAGRTAAAIAVAGAVAAVQMVPMALAAQASPRGLGRPDNFWSLHPLWLVESVLPRVFGNAFTAYNAQIPFVPPLNSGRDPFFYSIYVGPLVLLLSGLGLLTGSKRWRFFWLVAIVCSVVLAFGEYTPIYLAVQQVVPFVKSFRFPVKFFLFVSFALAMLVANATEALRARAGVRRVELPAWALQAWGAAGLLTALALMVLIGLVTMAPYTGARAFYDLGTFVGLADPIGGAQQLFSTVPPVAARVLIVLLTGALLAYVGWARGHEGGLARILLCGVAAADLIAVDISLNPTMPAASLGAPAWTNAVSAHPPERFYFGGKFRGSLIGNDVDLPTAALRPPEGLSVLDGRTLMMASLAMTPAAWHVRELLSYDLPQLWPVEHTQASLMFEHADRPARMRFLARGGVRYCLLNTPPHPDARPIQTIATQLGPLSVYECVPDARRAYVAADATVIADRPTALGQLFAESFDAERTVIIEREAPGAAGTAGPPAPPSARIARDEDVLVEIEATAPASGGYLVLLDSYDPSWRVDVDGSPAPLLRANALYRAVRLAPGRHAVRFTYRPTVLYAWLSASALAASAMAALYLTGRGR